MNRRIVVDTSTLVSAALFPGSIPSQALAEAVGRWDVCVSSETLDELERVLGRDKFDRYRSQTERRQFVALLRRNAQHFDVRAELLSSVRPTCRDPLDNKVLALALAAEAAVIVSSDEDLLMVNPWNGIAIMLAREFLLRHGSGNIDVP